MVENIFFFFFSIVVFVGLWGYIKRSKTWGKELFRTEKTTGELVRIIWLAIWIVESILVNMKAQSIGMWIRIGILILLLIYLLLPSRVFENGFRDHTNFVVWEEVQRAEIQRDEITHLTLKNPGLRRVAKLAVKSGDRLPIDFIEVKEM